MLREYSLDGIHAVVAEGSVVHVSTSTVTACGVSAVSAGEVVGASGASRASRAGGASSSSCTGRVLTIIFAMQVRVSRLAELTCGSARVRRGVSMHVPRLPFEKVMAGLPTLESATILLELGHRDSGESGGGVVLGGVVVFLVYWDGGVYDVGLNGLAVNNGLDLLMDVMVNVFATDNGLRLLSVSGFSCPGCVLELGLLGLEALVNFMVIAVFVLAVLDGDGVVVVLLWQSLFVMDGLDGGVVVILVDLLIHRGGDILMTVGFDSLVGNMRVHFLMHRGVVLPIFMPVLSVRCEPGNVLSMRRT